MLNAMATLNDEWLNFLQSGEMVTEPLPQTNITNTQKSELHISTKTILISLSSNFDVNHIFWNMDIMHYHLLKNGVIKKQTKIITTNAEEANELDENCQREREKGLYYTDSILESSKNIR